MTRNLQIDSYIEYPKRDCKKRFNETIKIKR